MLLLFLVFCPVREIRKDHNPTYEKLVVDLCSLQSAIFMYLDDFGSEVPERVEGKAAHRLALKACKYSEVKALLILKVKDETFLDPWGNPLVIFIERKRDASLGRSGYRNFRAKIYSIGPNRVDEGIRGDDVTCRW